MSKSYLKINTTSDLAKQPTAVSNIIVISGDIVSKDLSEAEKQRLFTLTSASVCRELLVDAQKATEEWKNLLCEIISKNQNLEGVLLRNIKFNYVQVVALSRFLERCKSLIKVEFTGCSLDENDVNEVTEVLKKKTNLKILVLGNNALNDKAASAVAKVIDTNTQLEQIHLYNTGIKITGAIAESLKNTRNLKQLNLAGNKVSTLEEKQAIADIIKNNPELEQLQIWGMNLGADGIELVADSIKDRPIKVLGITRNRMGDDGAKALADAIRNNKVLEDLRFGTNEISFEGIKVIADALRDKPNLKIVDGLDDEESKKYFFTKEELMPFVDRLIGNVQHRLMLVIKNSIEEFKDELVDKLYQLNFNSLLVLKKTIKEPEQYSGLLENCANIINGKKVKCEGDAVFLAIYDFLPGLFSCLNPPKQGFGASLGSGGNVVGLDRK